MRSRSNSIESSPRPKQTQQRLRHQHSSTEMEEPETGKIMCSKDKEYVAESDTILRSHKSGKTSRTRTYSEQGKDLSRDDLLFLLSVLEGELQLDKVIQKHKESHKRMLEQLLMVEKSQRQTLYELEDEKRKHTEYMEKSDEFTNLLEQERERLKNLIDQETTYQAKKEKETDKKTSKLKEELTKLKSFALMLVDEQQRLTGQLNQQSQKIQDLTHTAEQAHEKLATAEARVKEEEQKVTRLETELQAQTDKLHQDQEAMMAKLTNEDSQNRQLRSKLSSVSRQIDELEETNKSLRKAEEELQDLREKMNKGECGNSNLMAEMEELRKRVLEMEGKDEELIKMEDQCRDLNKKLDREAAQTKNLKAEVEKLNKRIMELEKLEDAFSRSKQECYALKCNLEKERTNTKQLSNELDSLKVRIRELEVIEIKLEKTELTLKEDLAKLKTLTVMLVDERKSMSEKINQTEEKLQATTTQLQAEQNKVTSITEKLIEESRKALKSKAELQEKIYCVTKEKDDLKSKLNAEEEKGNDLLSKVNILKKRLQSLEAIEKEFLKNKHKQENPKSTAAFQLENKKIKELTQEVERLKHTLKEMKAVEDDLMKTEDEFESLEQRYLNEQHKAEFLSEELEIVKKELAKYKLAEKMDSSQEHLLYKKLKEEEAKSGHLAREVDALKEKIHEYMATEDTICRLKGDYSVLQRRLSQQENKNRELNKEIENLSRELERYRHFSKSLRPSLNGRRISDLQVFSKEVQTDPTDNEPPDYKSLLPLERAVINGQIYEDSDDESNDEEQTMAFNSNSSTANSKNRKLWIPWMKSKENLPQNGKVHRKQNGNCVESGDLVLTHTPGQPLHIKVTPDHGLNTATLEITSPTSENPHSFTSTAVIPNCGTPKQRITIFQNASLTPVKSKIVDGYINPEQAMSPLTMTSFVRAKTSDSCGSLTPERTMSPIQVLAVTGSTNSPDHLLSPEAREISSTHAVFRVSPDRQAGWQIQRSNSTGSTSSIITTEDNKIHIHLGRSISPYSSGQENRTATLTNGTPSRPANKITSSIRITPSGTPPPRQSQITVSNAYK
uniref:Filamin A-interacting protein 1-like isoform X2 n=1 Tax=Geotrypetes seraphini TaxID=260995 RepID=A0A6P8QLJ1_GEOSA|nr:filamin A-interacting protein 1-like isoform X2 [Geotrypetes seraphini]